MPRLKPPPSQASLPQPQDRTPVSGDVEIDLGSPPAGETEIDLAAAPAESVVVPKVEPEIEEEQPLQKALDAQKRAEELQATAQRERDEAVRRAGERDKELVAERSEREDAQYNSVLTAISAEQSTIAKAEADYAGYASVGDWTNAAAAQRILASASARLDRLEDGKQSFDNRREVEKTKPPERQPAPQPRGFEEQISTLPEKAKVWLRNHPEFINDTALNNKIGAAHGYIVNNKGIHAFSDAYFDALDTEFGFKQAEPVPITTQRRSMPVSAPVSRDVPSASGVRASPTKMTLNEEERRIARSSFSAPDLTDAQKEYMYAKNKQKLIAARANGSYPQPERN